MSEAPLSEEEIFARHERIHGAVLIVGVGNVGSLLAEMLARLGISPLVLVDPENIEPENIVRHSVGHDGLGVNKALALASKIVREVPGCKARGIPADFRELPVDQQFELVRAANVVVVAADVEACREQVNKICIYVERRAVYPTIWVDDRTHQGEVAEITWTLPNLLTPCYKCGVEFRHDLLGGMTSGATRSDVLPLVGASVEAVRALLDPEAERSQFLDVEHTCMLVRGFMPPSPFAQELFRRRNPRYIRIPFPVDPCPACHGQAPPDPELERQQRLRADQDRRETERREAAARAEQQRIEAEAHADQWLQTLRAWVAEGDRRRKEAAEQTARAERQRREALEQLATEVLDGPGGLVSRYATALDIERVVVEFGVPVDSIYRLPPLPTQTTASERAKAFVHLLPNVPSLLRALAEHIVALAAQHREGTGQRVAADLVALASRLSHAASNLSSDGALGGLRNFARRQQEIDPTYRPSPGLWAGPESPLIAEGISDLLALREAVQEAERQQARDSEEAQLATAIATNEERVYPHAISALADILRGATDRARKLLPTIELGDPIEIFDGTSWSLCADSIDLYCAVWPQNSYNRHRDPESHRLPFLAAGFIGGSTAAGSGNIIYMTQSGASEWFFVTFRMLVSDYQSAERHELCGANDAVGFRELYQRFKEAGQNYIRVEPFTPQVVVRLLAALAREARG